MKALFSLVSCCFFAGGFCLFDKQTPSNIIFEETKNVLFDTIVYTIEERKLKYCVILSDGELCAKVDLTYPVLQNAENDTVQRKMQNYMDSLYFGEGGNERDFTLNFVTQVDEYKEEEEGAPSFFDFSGQTEITLNDNLFFSGYIATAEYSGGAHDYYETHYFNFDPQTGEIYHWQDLFSDTLQVYEEIRAQLTVRAAEENEMLFDYFNFYKDKFYVPDDFSVSEFGVTFHYGFYDILPYSEVSVGMPFGKE